MAELIVTESASPLSLPRDPRQIEYLRYIAALDSSAVPQNLHEGIARYLAVGIPAGSFLMAVFAGDNPTAVRRCDALTLAGYGPLLLWLAQHAPAESWGSEENVTAWLAKFQAAPIAVADSDIPY